MPFSIDKTDRLILKALQNDASISNLELSKSVGLSPSACLARTKNLIESGIIKQYTAILDEEKLGMAVQAFALIDLNPLNRETMQSFLEVIKKYPEVQACYTLTGNHAYLLKIVTKDIHAYREFVIGSIMQNPYISRCETNIVLGVDKCTTYIPVLEE